MGNTLGKLSCCCCRKEEETPNFAEEIPMEMIDETEELLDDTLDMEIDGQLTLSEDMADSPKEDPNESFRLRVVAEHFGPPNRPLRVEYRQLYDTLVPIDLIKNSDKTQCLFHISVYNNHKERVVDLTVIQGMGPDPTMEHVIYWKDPQEDSWRFNFSYRDTHKLYKQFQVSSLRKVFVWAATNHTKNNSEVNNVLLLSNRPGVIAVPSYIKRSAGCVIHITAYNLQLIRTLDVILIQGKKTDSQSDCYIQWRDPNTGRPQFSFTGPDGAEAFRRFFN